MIINKIKEAVLAELAGRELQGGYYASVRGQTTASIDAQHAAIHILGVLGEEMDSISAETLNSFQRPDGNYGTTEPSPHKLDMVLIALNLLGAKPRYSIEQYLAPPDENRIAAWVDNHDWNTTHKNLSAAVFPRLCREKFSETWLDCLLDRLAHNFDKWLKPGADRWEVISRLYHILQIHILARKPFPFPERIMSELDRLQWDANGAGGNFCTDFDYALLITNLPYSQHEKQSRLNRILDRKIQHWNDAGPEVLAAENHQIFCYLTGLAVYQQLLPDRFDGPVLRDVYHDRRLREL